jgi:hypothetical protein
MPWRRRPTQNARREIGAKNSYPARTRTPFDASSDTIADCIENGGQSETSVGRSAATGAALPGDFDPEAATRDPELAAIIVAWPTLPAEAKAAIMAIVEAARE